MSVPDVSGSAIANLEVETLIHRNPTFHGDTIYAETRVLEKTPSKSKDDRGIVTVETKGFNQDGLEVCYFRRKVMVWKREFAPERQRPYSGDVWRNDHTAFRRVLRRSAPGLARDLPWIDTDPWPVLVSEVMLQQTQTSRVITPWTKFVEAFSTPTSCADAPLSECCDSGVDSAITVGRKRSTTRR